MFVYQLLSAPGVWVRVPRTRGRRASGRACGQRAEVRCGRGACANEAQAGRPQRAQPACTRAARSIIWRPAGAIHHLPFSWAQRQIVSGEWARTMGRRGGVRTRQGPLRATPPSRPIAWAGGRKRASPAGRRHRQSCGRAGHVPPAAAAHK